MLDPKVLEDHYQNFMKNLSSYLPDGVAAVDIKLIEELGLLKIEETKKEKKAKPDSSEALNYHFHVIETEEKITLYNEAFSIWIVPHNTSKVSKTFVFIGTNQKETPHLETAFFTEGAFNTPKYIMKILQHYLDEVRDVEAVIASIGKKEPN